MLALFLLTLYSCFSLTLELIWIIYLVLALALTPFCLTIYLILHCTYRWFAV
jgi:hypothetical protein